MAFAAFAAYRDLGPSSKRPLKGLKDANGVEFNYHSVRNWHNIYHWRERARRWDQEMDRQARERLLFERGVTAERHFDLARRLLDKIETRLETLKPEELNPRDIKDWLAVAAPLQRLSMEMSTQISETREGDAQDATNAVRDLLKNPAAAQIASQLGDMLLNEHPRPEPVQSRADRAHLHVVESAQPGDEAE